MFVQLLEAVVTKFGWQLFAFVLMSNHFHLLLQLLEENLALGMKELENAYAKYFNRTHRWCQARLKARQSRR
jgi:REP element-mobilizing transposase RayT